MHRIDMRHKVKCSALCNRLVQLKMLFYFMSAVMLWSISFKSFLSSLVIFCSLIAV